MSTTTSPSPSPIDPQSLLAEFDRSGQSAAAFARTRGIPPWRIYHLLQRRRGKVRVRRSEVASREPALVPVRVVPDTASSRPASLELVLAGGQRVLIGPDFDAALLRRLLGALAQC